MNFGHTSSVIALCVKLVLLTTEMVRSSVDKAERMEGEKKKSTFFLVFPASEKAFVTGRHITRKESIGPLPDRNNYINLLFY